jgi:CcmD family protein
MSEWRYIFAAYAVTWLVVVGYGVYLAVRRRAAERTAVTP